MKLKKLLSFYIALAIASLPLTQARLKPIALYMQVSMAHHTEFLLAMEKFKEELDKSGLDFRNSL